MLTTARKQVKAQRANTAAIPAPLGGWNARDPLGAMDVKDAVTLTNLFPATSSVYLRKGYTQHATGITGQVQTVMSYAGGTANTLFAAAGTSVYDVTSGGAVGAASLTGVTNAKWQYVNFRTTGGSYLLMVNNADKQRVWDGSAWHKDGDGAPYDITNLNTATATNLTVFKNRLWYTESGTLKAWYLPINAIGGAATSLDMSSIMPNGGYLVAAMTWTLDAGYGVDDNLVFITNKGDVAVWRLTDPTTPSGIGLIGVFMLGSPIGYRCWTKYAGDLLIITQDGVVPMSGALQSSRLDPRVSITDKIKFSTSEAITLYGANFGWEIMPFPQQNMLILNVPVNEGSSQQQYVMNMITRSWCNFTGWAANCWEIFNDGAYFGGNGYVGHAWNTTTDNGAGIQAFALQSFQTFRTATQKQCKMVRFHTISDGAPGMAGNVNTDYDLADHAAVLGSAPFSQAAWGSGVWGTGLWGSTWSSSALWETATGIGSALAPTLKVTSNGPQLQWVSTDIVYEVGGVL